MKAFYFRDSSAKLVIFNPECFAEERSPAHGALRSHGDCPFHLPYQIGPNFAITTSVFKGSARDGGSKISSEFTKPLTYPRWGVNSQRIRDQTYSRYLIAKDLKIDYANRTTNPPALQIFVLCFAHPSAGANRTIYSVWRKFV